MALIRAEIRQRLGDSSIYDGVVEYPEDFENERMLASVHPGSLMICLNHQEGSDEGDEATSDLYIKLEDGSWGIMKGPGGGGGGEVTPASIVTATGNMTAEQAAQMLSNIGGEPEFFVCTFADDLMTCDKSFTEAKSAYEAGKTILFVYKDSCNIAQYNETDDTFDAYLVKGTVDVSVIALFLVDFFGAVGYEEKLQKIPAVYNISGAAPSISPGGNAIYKCGTLTSLTITNPPATGSYSIIFYSGATPTVVTGIDNFTVQANKRYRIDVSDGYATFDSWPYTP